MLDVQSLEAWYGQAQVLFSVSLGVAAGECVALVGRNGAGKSTTMKAIMGLMARRRGRVVFRGADISTLPVNPKSRQWMKHMSPGVDLHPDFGPSYGEQPVPYGIPITVVNGSSDSPDTRWRCDSTPSGS